MRSWVVVRRVFELDLGAWALGVGPRLSKAWAKGALDLWESRV